MRTTKKITRHSFFRAFGLRAAGIVVLAAGLSPVALSQRCAPLVLHGTVAAGESYTQPMSPALDFKLEAVPAGWMIRVLPHGRPRPQHDYAELANPPYRSPTPLLISTDFSFRAQDAIAWNPRRFQYFTSERERGDAESALQEITGGKGSADGTMRLLQIVPLAAQANLTIIDAELVAGTANQTAAASRVALHFAQTAHRVRTDVTPSALGRLLRLSFRVEFPDGQCRSAH